MTLDRLVVDQKVELFEVITGWEIQNKYVIKDDQGQVVYYAAIIQNWNLIRPSFSVLDSTGDSVLSLKGPICMCSCIVFNFPILSADGEHKVGKISKRWLGFFREVCTDANKFEINFPTDLDVKMKAVLLGACFLIDFMYFEDNQSC